MKKVTRALTVFTMCLIMLVSSAGISMVSAIDNVKNLAVKSTSTSGISLQWSSVSGAKGYRIYKYTGTEKKWRTLKTTTSLTYKDTSVKAGEVYYYRVKAYQNVKGKAVFSKEYSNTVKTIVPPSKVTELKSVSVNGSSVTLSWKKAANVTGYRIYTYNSSTKKYTSVGTTAKTSYTVKKLKSNTSYTFAVRAYKTSDKTVYGAYSSRLSVKTRLADIKKFEVSSVTENSYTFKWDKASGVTGYQLVKYDESTKKWTKILTTKKTTATVSGKNAVNGGKFRIRTYLKKGGKYTYGLYSSTLTANKLSAVPKNLKGAVNSDNGISLTWSKVTGASGYTVYSYSAQNGSWKTVGSTTKNSFSIKNIKNTDTYRYAVCSYVYSGGKKFSSEKCESVSIAFVSESKPDSIYSEEMADNGILGFLFDPKEGCFYTSSDPWQRVVGYNEIFDVMGPYTLIDFDTVRLYFEHGNKDWLIQLWKGQYGLVFYGAEVGVYTKPKNREVKHYDAASDSEMLKMSMTFIEKEKVLFSGTRWNEKFTRPYGYYWWCTGFLPGNRYGKYENIKLDMRITMKDYEMLSGVTAALNKNGISYSVKGLDVYFVYN